MSLIRLQGQSERKTKSAPGFSSFLESIRPFDQTWDSSIPSLFLGGLADPNEITRFSEIIARDGLFPLASFFRMKPKPGKFRGRIFIHQNYEPFVPSAWRRQVGIYRLTSRPEKKAQKARPKGLFLPAISLEPWCSLDHLDRLLRRAVDHYGRPALSRFEKRVMLVPKAFGYGAENHPDYYARFLLGITRELGGSGYEVIFPGALEYSLPPDFEGFDILDLNEGFLCATPVAVHMALQRGARLSPVSSAMKSKKGETYLPLSTHHGLMLQHSLAGRSIWDQAERDKKARGYFSRANYTVPNWPLPWSCGHEFWCRWINLQIRQKQKGAGV